MTLLQELRTSPAGELSPDELGTGELLADAAVDALIGEALLTPKPGLVDGRGSGVHDDMTLDLLLRSAYALRETFRLLAEEGRSGKDDQQLRISLAEIGRAGEQIMMATTDGVNTHRGAIWALGLAIAANSAVPYASVDAVVAKISGIARFDDVATLGTSPTKGSLVRAHYGVGGAVAQARAGFPHAITALAALRHSRSLGNRETIARLDALLAAMSGLDDTCLLARGGQDTLRTTQRLSTDALRAGGAGTNRGSRTLRRLDRHLADQGASPGGSADMLALALFLDSTCSEDTSNRVN